MTDRRRRTRLPPPRQRPRSCRRLLSVSVSLSASVCASLVSFLIIPPPCEGSTSSFGPSAAEVLYGSSSVPAPRGRRREGRAELLESTIGSIDDDFSAKALSDDIGDASAFVPAVPPYYRRNLDDEEDGSGGWFDSDGVDHDGCDGPSLQLALPSFDDLGPSSLTSLLLSRRSPMSYYSPSRDGPSEVRARPIPSFAPTNTDRGLNLDHLPTLRKTGTTIVGVICDSGRTVVIGADTRATDGTVVADKRCEKVHRLASNVWCCGAGTSGDIDALVRRVRYAFLLRGMVSGSIGNIPMDDEEEKMEEGDDDNGRAKEWDSDSNIEGEQGLLHLPPASVSAVCRYIRDRLYDAGGSIGANLVLGGYDVRSGRAVLTAIHPHGSMDVVPYTALGSGGLAATAVLESRYPVGGTGEGGDTEMASASSLSVEDAVELVQDAVGAGIAHDMGSGSQVDLCIIGPGGTTYRRAVIPEEELPHGGQGEKEAERVLGKRHTTKEGGKEDVIMNGVNGFGSLPYFVKSRRVVMEGEEAVQESHRRSMDAWLGLEESAESDLNHR